ncbi:hypothetical protein UFOVP67_6 [uncultured Caudovirales phage]|uniref:Uncharacterized protein n=1 Tax=uncultured Caudovirales phage TaxID=2100421 RepID=A0A6J5TAI2_9CAUD|nr:hypothetical protein UFOVP67_6 [uncultured Caudovirales phage]
MSSIDLSKDKAVSYTLCQDDKLYTSTLWSSYDGVDFSVEDKTTRVQLASGRLRHEEVSSLITLLAQSQI